LLSFFVPLFIYAPPSTPLPPRTSPNFRWITPLSLLKGTKRNVPCRPSGVFVWGRDGVVSPETCPFSFTGSPFYRHTRSEFSWVCSRLCLLSLLFFSVHPAPCLGRAVRCPMLGFFCLFSDRRRVALPPSGFFGSCPSFFLWLAQP